MPSINESIRQDHDEKQAKSSDPAKKLARRRDREQQEFLKRCRDDLISSIKDFPKATDRHKINISRILASIHKASWPQISPLLRVLPSVPDALPLNAAIVFGGWMLPPPDVITNGVAPPSEKLFFDLLSHELYSGVTTRFEELVKNPQEPDHARLKSEFNGYVASHQAFFDPLGIETEDPLSISERLLPDLRRSIERALYFIEGRAFIFYPTPQDPFRGWVDFFSFVRAYDALPDQIKLRFAPYYMMIQIP